MVVMMAGPLLVCRAARVRPLCMSTPGWNIPPCWSTALDGVEGSPQFQALREAVTNERAAFSVLPPEADQLAAFRAVPFEQTRVVLLGQDPYPTRGHAMGLSFSVGPGVTPPGSLRNMYKELEADLGIPPATHGCLDAWASQGVFLLNTALTVRSAAWPCVGVCPHWPHKISRGMDRHRRPWRVFFL